MVGGGGAAADRDANPIKSAAAPEVREQDRFMPIANVIRIMRRVLPAYAKISDDAKETIQECVSEYISFITGEANERCQREQRKTITADDVLWAMSKLGFDDYVHPLALYLRQYRQLEGGDHRLPIVIKPPPPHAPQNFAAVPNPNANANAVPAVQQYQMHQYLGHDAYGNGTVGGYYAARGVFGGPDHESGGSSSSQLFPAAMQAMPNFDHPFGFK
uniref:Transcription factor CBF/NF-Y/archaeal histone domain-containing protein n=1 Tax=Ananas comosus var. bracteatus TaxID=296719 RepID=A0A6V7QW33_ANACO